MSPDPRAAERVEVIPVAEANAAYRVHAGRADRAEAENERLRDALYAVLPLAEVPGTPAVVAQKLRGIVGKALGNG